MIARVDNIKCQSNLSHAINLIMSLLIEMEMNVYHATLIDNTIILNEWQNNMEWKTKKKVDNLKQKQKKHIIYISYSHMWQVKRTGTPKNRKWKNKKECQSLTTTIKSETKINLNLKIRKSVH